MRSTEGQKGTDNISIVSPRGTVFFYRITGKKRVDFSPKYKHLQRTEKKKVPKGYFKGHGLKSKFTRFTPHAKMRKNPC